MCSMELNDCEEMVKVLGACLSQIRWRLRSSTRRRLETGYFSPPYSCFVLTVLMESGALTGAGLWVRVKVLILQAILGLVLLGENWSRNACFSFFKGYYICKENSIASIISDQSSFLSSWILKIIY